MRTLRRTAAVLASLLAVAAIAAGCGGDDEDSTVTDTVSAETETTATEPAETSAATVPSGGAQGPDYFQTPSGNIGCYVGAEAARCDIRNRDWEPPPGDPAEKNCELDYGQGIVVSETHAEFVCAGDTALGGPKTLGYGQSSQRGRFVCESEPDGITCSHLDSGHGFFLSKESYRIF